MDEEEINRPPTDSADPNTEK